MKGVINKKKLWYFENAHKNPKTQAIARLQRSVFSELKYVPRSYQPHISSLYITTSKVNAFIFINIKQPGGHFEIIYTVRLRTENSFILFFLSN